MLIEGQKRLNICYLSNQNWAKKLKN